MKSQQFLRSVALSLVALSVQLHAGETPVLAANPPPPADDYVGGRGLLTIQGPTGLFINPTSGTMPAGAFTAQYCFFLPNNESTPVMAHGALLSYGVTDWLEVGALGGALDIDNSDDLYSGGPLVRARLMKQDEVMPEVSIGGYAFFGDEDKCSAFLALFKSLEISKDGIVRSVGFHAGLRETYLDSPAIDQSDAPVGYCGLEVELPFRLYLVGEVSTNDDDSGDRTPFAYGLQWRLGGINISTAMTNPGFVNEPSFFFGIGTQFKF